MPAKLSEEGQDFINKWPCSDETTTLQNCYSVRTTAITFRN